MLGLPPRLPLELCVPEAVRDTVQRRPPPRSLRATHSLPQPLVSARPRPTSASRPRTFRSRSLRRSARARRDGSGAPWFRDPTVPPLGLAVLRSSADSWGVPPCLDIPLGGSSAVWERLERTGSAGREREGRSVRRRGGRGRASRSHDATNTTGTQTTPLRHTPHTGALPLNSVGLPTMRPP